jgi:hypothetical protein
VGEEGRERRFRLDRDDAALVELAVRVGTSPGVIASIESGWLDERGWLAVVAS